MADEPDNADAPGPSRRGLAIAAAILGVLIALSIWCAVRNDPDASRDQSSADTDADPADPDAGPVAHVQGQVWLEQVIERSPDPAAMPPKPAVPVVIVENGRVRVIDPNAPDTDGVDAEAPADDAAHEHDDARVSETRDVAAEGEDARDPDAAAREDDEAAGADASVRDDDDHERDTDAAPATAVGAARGDTDAEPDAVELVAPEPGACTVVAWQSGIKVGGPTTCADDGSFDVALDPGAFGPTAFEILVPGRLRAVVQVDVPQGSRGRLPAVALGVAQTLVGQVVDGRGNPVPDVAIEAMPSPNLGEPEPWRVTSSADGTFVIDTLPPGPVGLRATADGYAPSLVEAIVPSDDVLVVLDALMTLEGRVIGAPELLARARVRLEGSGVWPAREAAVADDGAFLFPEIPDGVYAIEAIVPAANPDDSEYASIPLENVTPDLQATLALTEAYSVPVRVVDPSGDPLPDARVTLGNAALGLLQRVATTDAEGRVRIGPVVPGPYILRADAEGYLPPVPIAVSVDGPDIAEQVLRMAIPGTLAGIVVDEDDRPVAGARVRVTAEALHTIGESKARAQMLTVALQNRGSLGVTVGPVPPIPTIDEDDPDDHDLVTNADGRFSVTMLPPGRYRLSATHGHYAESAPIDVTLRASETRGGIVLVLRGGHRLTGRVLDGNGRPIAHAQIELPEGAIVTTDRVGVFDAGPRRGTTRIVVRARGMAPAERTVTVRDRPVDVEIVLVEADGELAGRIEGENGEPLADARVTLRLHGGLWPTEVAWTDAKGVYAFTKLPRGRAEIVVDHPDHGEVTRDVQVDVTRDVVDIALPRGWSVLVEVLAEGTRDPISGVYVVAGGHHALTDREGRATIKNLTEPSITIRASAEGYGSASGSLARPADDTLGSVRLTLRQGGGIAGRITDYRGDPVGEVVVVAIDPVSEREIGHAVTGGDGRYAIDGLPEGDVEIRADPPAARAEELAPAALATDVLRGHVTRGTDLRFDRR